MVIINQEVQKLYNGISGRKINEILQTHTLRLPEGTYDLLNLKTYFMLPVSTDFSGTNLYVAYNARCNWLLSHWKAMPLEELVCTWLSSGLSMPPEHQQKGIKFLDDLNASGQFPKHFIFGSTLAQNLLYSEVGTYEHRLLTTPPDKKPKSGFMYVIQLDGCIKVGFSTDVDERMKQFESTSMRVDLLHKVPALLSQEKEFHKLFNNKSEKYSQSAKDIIKVIAVYLNRYSELMDYLKAHKGSAKKSQFDLALTFANRR